MHIIFYETNPFEPRKVGIIDDDDVGILKELNHQQGAMERD